MQSVDRNKANQYSRDWYQRNRERILLRQRENTKSKGDSWEKRKARQRAYYERNREVVLGKQLARQRQNPELSRERHKKRLEKRATHPRPDRCEACGNFSKGGRPLSFDHCHLFGHFRGWLCHECNVSLGLLEDDPKRLKALIRYLKERDHPN